MRGGKLVGKNAPGWVHGHNPLVGRESPTHSSWSHTVERTENPNHVAFARYGGAGVRLCRGLRDFVDFLAVLGLRPKGTTLGRWLNLGPYSCGQCAECRKKKWLRNCAWQTRSQQAAEMKGRTAMKHAHERTAIHRRTLSDWKRTAPKAREQKAA
jgi:hypothetical protein